ncbi:MAG: Mur ligase family protein, partial [Calditrichia bacterium]
DRLYSEEISLVTSPEYLDYVYLNLRKIQEIRRNFSLPVIGVTGAEGKTTTKRMLAAILSQRGAVLETPLDCNSASVVTSTLLKLNKDYKHAIIELGIINGDQFKLAVEVAEPNIGIVTNIGEAHMASLGDKYLIADAKVELIRQLPENGFAVLNIDDELVSGMEAFSPTQRVIKFGFNSNAHFFASDIKYLGPEGMEFTVNNYYKFHLPIYSSTSVSNALAAISTARILNFEFEEIKQGLENNFELLPGRGNLVDLKDVYILDHTYKATVNAVTKACESLVQFKKFSKHSILVIGSMDELGNSSEDIHLNLGYYISALPIDTVITVGKDAGLVGEGIRRINHNNKIIDHCLNPDALPDTLMKRLVPHTTILMIGGKSLNLQEKLRQLKQKIQSR